MKHLAKFIIYAFFIVGCAFLGVDGSWAWYWRALGWFGALAWCSKALDELEKW